MRTTGIRLDALFAAGAVFAVGFGFAMQNIAQNFISGLILLVEQPVRKGDYVKVGGSIGEIEDIGLRATHIVTRDEVTAFKARLKTCLHRPAGYPSASLSIMCGCTFWISCCGRYRSGSSENYLLPEAGLHAGITGMKN